MPSPTTERSVVEVPDAAVEALAAIRWREHTGEEWYGVDGPLLGDRERMLDTCRRHLAAALPSLEESFRERVREDLRPLFDAIDSPDGSLPDIMRVSEEAQRAWYALHHEVAEPVTDDEVELAEAEQS